MKKLHRGLAACLVLILCVLPTHALAQETDPRYLQKQQEIEALKTKINQLQGEAKTLSSAITYLSNKKDLTQKQIDATVYEITLINRDISSLNGKIGTLENSLDEHVKALITDVQVGYKQPEIGPFQLVFSSSSFTDFETRARYLTLAQVHHSQALKKATEVKLDYDAQKTQKETKQRQVATLQKKLTVQQKDLAIQEEAKRKILADTKNNESTYQRQLAVAQAELSSFRAFTSSKGGGVLAAQDSPDGWFYSQRDERWANYTIGNSALTRDPDTILEVGCLVSSVAMVKKKYGESVTPRDIAANPGYFYLNTGSMRRPWPAPSGYRFETVDRRDLGAIDAELREGKPVIVKLSVRTNTVGTHFIVLKSGANGDYTIHDPWEGYDKKFSQFYSTSQIIGAGYLRKS